MTNFLKAVFKVNYPGFDLDIDLKLPASGITVVFGPSGSGKTTTLRAIAGLLRPSKGHIEIGDRVVYDSASGAWQPAHKRRIGYLSQQYHLFPHLRVAENVAYGVPDRSSEMAGTGVGALLEVFQLDGLERRYPWELSGGQQQRVALARALAQGMARGPTRTMHACMHDMKVFSQQADSLSTGSVFLNGWAFS